ncbi:MAG: FlgD immunoglobulin-like domain containing protein [Candidatus Goldiibacteriota bacterium]
MKKSILRFFSVIILAVFAVGGEVSGANDTAKAHGPRAAGMGGAFTAVADDIYAYYWNPAGLVMTKKGAAGGFYDSVFRGKQVNFGFHFIHPVKEGMTFSGVYARTVFLGTEFLEDVFYLSYGTYIDDMNKTALGVNFKSLGRAAPAYGLSAQTFSVDAGMMYFPDFLDGKMRLGLLVRNMDAEFIYNNGTNEKIPAKASAGASYKFDESSVIAADIGMFWDEKRAKYSFHLGGEKWFENTDTGNFGFRGGLALQQGFDPVWTFNFGFSYSREDFTVDYVFIPGFRKLGETHKISFTYYIGDEVKKESAKEVIGSGKDMPGSKRTADMFADMTMRVSGKYFSPDSNGIKDKIYFYFDEIPGNTGIVNAETEITDNNGERFAVKNYIGRMPEMLEWNGMNNSEEAAPDGAYNAAVRIKKDGEILWEKAVNFVVDKKPPVSEVSIDPKVFAASPASTVKEMNINIYSKTDDVKRWILYIQDNNGSTVRKYSGEGIPKSFLWDGRDAVENYIKDGKYRVVLSLEDFAGNTYEASDFFTVDTRVINFNADIENRIFKAGSENISFLISSDETGKIAYWSIAVKDNKGNVVKRFDRINGGTAKIQWDGKNAEGEYVRPGSIYRYTVTVTQRSGMKVSREGMLQADLPVFRGAGMRLTIAAVRFGPKEKSIPLDDYTYLEQAAEAIKEYAKDYHVYIKAYAYDTNDSLNNFELSAARAAAVKEYFIKGKGIPAGNIYIIGYGDGEYSEDVERETAEKKGTRAEVELITK